MMDNMLFYVCPNWEYPNIDSDDPIELESPLYEDVLFSTNIERLNLYGVEDLMSLYTDAAERAYFSIDISSLEKSLIRVEKLKTVVSANGTTRIESIFEDGSIYVPERTFLIEDGFTEDELNIIVDLAKEASA